MKQAAFAFLMHLKPATLWLLAAGLLVLGVICRRIASDRATRQSDANEK